MYCPQFFCCCVRYGKKKGTRFYEGGKCTCGGGVVWAGGGGRVRGEREGGGCMNGEPV